MTVVLPVVVLFPISGSVCVCVRVLVVGRFGCLLVGAFIYIYIYVVCNVMYLSTMLNPNA